VANGIIFSHSWFTADLPRCQVSPPLSISIDGYEKRRFSLRLVGYPFTNLSAAPPYPLLCPSLPSHLWTGVRPAGYHPKLQDQVHLRGCCGHTACTSLDTSGRRDQVLQAESPMLKAIC